MGGLPGRRGSVQKQRFHEQHSSRRDDARHGCDGELLTGYLCGGQAAKAVGSGKHAKSAVRFVTIVQVYSDREHALQNRDRRLDVMDAGFPGPGSVARHFRAIGDADGHVLVPGNKPVGGSGLIKKHPSDGNGGVAEVFRDDRHQ
jgi:hypothetical protein